MALYASCYLRRLYRITSYALVATSYSLILVAVFDEVYEIHYTVSVAFFLMLAITTALYTVESHRIVLGTVLLTVGLGSWILYFQGIYRAGIAVPELISSLSTTTWILLETFRGRG